jgi:hypothetical protein
MRTILALVIVLFGFQQGASAQQVQEPAGASAYLVGVFDTREERTTLLQIVNPTSATLRLYIAFFDADEEFQNCILADDEFTPNDLQEFDARQIVPNMVGVVKVVTMAIGEEDRPQIGAVGNQRLSVGREPVAETGLHPIQMAFLDAELGVLEGPERCNF